MRIEIEPLPLDVSVEPIDGVAVSTHQEPVPVRSAGTVATTDGFLFRLLDAPDPIRSPELPARAADAQ